LKKKYWAGGVVQVVECMPSKPEALSSNPSTGKKKRKEKNIAKLFCNQSTRPEVQRQKFCMSGLVTCSNVPNKERIVVKGREKQFH
jgi:hypothetical protein